MGEIRQLALAIDIRSDLAPEFKTHVLWHEIMHEISDQFALGLNEDQVNKLAIGVNGVLVDNPAMRKL